MNLPLFIAKAACSSKLTGTILLDAYAGNNNIAGNDFDSFTARRPYRPRPTKPRKRGGFRGSHAISNVVRRGSNVRVGHHAKKCC